MIFESNVISLNNETILQEIWSKIVSCKIIISEWEYSHKKISCSYINKIINKQTKIITTSYLDIHCFGKPSKAWLLKHTKYQQKEIVEELITYEVYLLDYLDCTVYSKIDEDIFQINFINLVGNSTKTFINKLFNCEYLKNILK